MRFYASRNDAAVQSGCKVKVASILEIFGKSALMPSVLRLRSSPTKFPYSTKYIQ
jgi:hypothetical protein